MAWDVEEKTEDKQPYLSPEMIAIINRSHQDGSDGDIYYDDNERYKYIIMEKLIKNEDILWTLHTKELEDARTQKEKEENPPTPPNGDKYRDVSIFNFLKIPGIQSTVKNFICFEVHDVEHPRYNDHLMIKNIMFRTISHEDDYKTDYGIARQDLLAAIIKSEFDWSNIFGMHLELIYDKGRVAEDGYYYREFVYETTIPNNLLNKAKNGGVGYVRN